MVVQHSITVGRRLLITAIVILLPVMARAQNAEEHDSETTKVTAPGAYRPKLTPDLDRVAAGVLKETNAFRAANKLGNVETSSKLQEAAAEFARYMAKTDRYGHEADGRQPQGRAEKHGYQYCLIAENIAYAFDSDGFSTEQLIEQFVKGWEDSPPHRRNMLDPDVVEIAIGIAQSKDTGVFYAVQMFGRPESMRIEFAIANESEQTVAYTLGGKKFTLPPSYARTHQRCRPSELRFTARDNFAPTAKVAERSYQPENGSRYTVRGVDDKQYTIEAGRKAE